MLTTPRDWTQIVTTHSNIIVDKKVSSSATVDSSRSRLEKSTRLKGGRTGERLTARIRGRVEKVDDSTRHES